MVPLKLKKVKFMTKYDKMIEALMFIQGDEGLSVKSLQKIIQFDLPRTRQLLQAFSEKFNAQERGLIVAETNDIFYFLTKKEFDQEISQLVTIEKKQRLSSAALETVGIIAYKQPITKPQINEIRGIASEAVVNTLLIKGLIEEKGVAKTIGNPVLYGITTKFYQYFGIKSLQELPDLKTFDYSDGIDQDFDLFTSQRE